MFLESALAAAVLTTASPALHTFTSDASGFDTHSFWLDTGKEVVVFDAQFTDALAEKLIAEICSKTRFPIRFVVVTHPNPDKFNGVTAFQKIGAKAIASEATARAVPGVHAYKKYFFVNLAKMFTEQTYPKQASIDQTFTGEYVLPLEGKTRVELRELKHPGVSSTQTVALIPSAHALIVGDLVHDKAHAWLEGGIVDGKPSPDIDAWLAALEELRTFKGFTVHGGRGQTAPVEDAVKREQAYLRGMRELVTKYVSDLGAKKAELSGPNAGAHHKAIAGLAAKKFPDYQLAYLVEYGVYGLANAIAARTP